MFPLGSVLLPGASLPLHIFEPRYRQLVADLTTGAAPGGCFGVVAIRRGWEVGTDNVEALHDIGCSALLREARRLPDGRFDIVARGERRFRLLDVDTASAPYLIGKVEWVPDTEPVPEIRDLLPVLASSARQAHGHYCRLAWNAEDWAEPPEDVTCTDLAYLLAADCLLYTGDRQHLLELTCPARRLRWIRQVLVRETAILRALRAVPAHVSEFAELPSRN
ncbi:peptidase [Longimycelium tulufanense]|uniref:Peptidase n=1 Tax=Longimycelium tulufanense TaxID=907463 RepID=A0A8J3CA59_9PSEU|nr:peptidase [Longimycelium tulufanense]